MKMGLRWYGPGYDSVSLEQIRQIPGVTGVITTLYGKQPGEVWEREEIVTQASAPSWLAWLKKTPIMSF